MRELSPAAGHARIDVIPCPPLKRALDLAFSAVGLLVTLPIALVAAAAIKLEDGGPIFFTQARVGEGGATFHVFKFRSMIVEAEATVGALQATEHDPRVTRIGRVLRASPWSWSTGSPCGTT